MSLSQVNARMEAAVAALDAGDQGTAILEAKKAQAYLAALPDSIDNSTSLTWDRRAIAEFIAECRQDDQQSLGIQRTKIVHTRTSASS